jgi:hypothetical protein
MNSIVRQKHRGLHKRNSQTGYPNLPLDLVLALDRVLVEVSMQLYNVEGRDRSRMRRQNRRLHAAMKRHFPRPLPRRVKS